MIRLTPSDLRGIANDLEAVNNLSHTAGGSIPLFDSVSEPAGFFSWSEQYGLYFYTGDNDAAE